jgi:predicted NBD/HSP70 family sugar kinase
MDLLTDKYARSVLQALYAGGAQTRKQIMTCLKMRLNALVEIINQLASEGYIVPLSEHRQRNNPLQLNQRRFASVGVEHSVDKLHCVLLGIDGRRLASTTYALEPALGGQQRLDFILERIQQFLNNQSDWGISTLGFADIGIVNTEKGQGVCSVLIPDWQNVRLEEILCQKFGLFTRIVDRSGAGALDLLRTYPDDEDIRTSLQIFVGDGIGASILQNGSYWGATTPSSCQLGHIVVKSGGRRCSCGGHGCLEAEASIPAMMRQALELGARGLHSREDFLRLTKRENLKCLQAVCEGSALLGMAVAGLVTFTGITSIILHSELCQYSQMYVENFEETVRKNVMLPFASSLRFQASQQGQDCSALGAAYYAQREYFSFSD